MTETHDLNWAVVRKAVETKLERLRLQNDSVEHGPTETAALRGEIRALKWLLRLPQEVAEGLKRPPPAMPGSESF